MGELVEYFNKQAKTKPRKIGNKKAEKKESTKIKFRARLPGNSVLISDFAKEICGGLIKRKAGIFYKPKEREIVEISSCEMLDKNETKTEYFGFITIDADRFINLLEEHIVTYTIVYIKDKGLEEVNKSLPKTAAKTILKNDCWKKLRIIRRIFTAPIPIIVQGELTFPKKKYDERFSSWLIDDAPEIDETISVKKAKETLKKIYGEFCFKDKQSYTNAISHLITEFAVGLLPEFNTLKPMFLWEANRERSGKDFGGVIPGLVMEGKAIQDAPFATDNKNNNSSEEFRKKITSLLMSGRRRIHSSNNRGCLKNEVLEAIITLKQWSDRLLGGNKLVTFDNELIFSASANIGYTATPDIIKRMRIIRLHLGMEDPNKRTFKNPNLHSWILENRSLILSSLFAFVKKWYDEGMPKGKTPFTSFPEWAEIIGGIMVCNGLGDPCVAEDTSLISADRESSDMKTFFELVYGDFPNIWKKKAELVELIRFCKDYGELFSYLDFNNKSGITTFAFILKKYVGRIFSDIRLECEASAAKAKDHKFRFTKTNAPEVNVDIFDVKKNEKTTKEHHQRGVTKKGNVGNLGNLFPTGHSKKSKYTQHRENVTNVANVALLGGFSKEKFLESVKLCYGKAHEKKMAYEIDLVDYWKGVLNENEVYDTIDELAAKGFLASHVTGYWVVL